MRALIIISILQICYMNGKVIYSPVNPMFNSKNVGFGLSKYVFMDNITTEFDAETFFDSEMGIALRKYINTKNSSIQSLNVTEQCNAHLQNLLNNFQYYMNFKGAIDIFKHDFWSVNVFDSYGKPPPYIMGGQNAWIGNYKECVEVDIPKFQGKYCLAQIPTSYTDFGLIYGFCMPKMCDSRDVNEIVNDTLTYLPEQILKIFNTSRVQVFCNPGSVPVDGWTYLGISIISFIVILVMAGTLIDIFQRYTDKKDKQKVISDRMNEPTTSSIIKAPIDSDFEMKNRENDVKVEDFGKLKIKENDEENTQNQEVIVPKKKFIEMLPFQILKSFSAYTNTIELFDITVNKKQLTTFDAMRVISIAWVILGHTIIFIFLIIANKMAAKERIPKMWFQVVLNGVLAVDTFFVMSGFLLTYVFLKICDKRKPTFNKLFVFKFYFHRYWRITPAYMMSLMISALFSAYFASGPFYPAGGFEPNRCLNSWWKNILYLNNFALGYEPMCFSHSWYLANDMQFHWISLLMLIPLYKYKDKFKFNIGIGIALILMVISFIATFVTLILNPGFEMGIFNGVRPLDYLYVFYVKPWIRIQTFLGGIIGGYILYEFKKQNKPKLNWKFNLLGWFLSFVIMNYVVFSTSLDYTQNRPSRAYHILYQTFYKPFWAFAICFIIFACNTGNGGIIKSILTWRVWIPLSRLSYGAYLAHYGIIQLHTRSQMKVLFYTDINFTWIYTSNIVFSFLAAYFITIFFEIPFVKLEKYIF